MRLCKKYFAKVVRNFFIFSLMDSLSLSLSLSRECTSSLSLCSVQRVILSFVFLDIMNDDVADKLEKMKLTIEEEEIIPILDERRLDAIESCNLSLMGKFLTCKPFNRMVTKNTIRRAWGLNDSL